VNADTPGGCKACYQRARNLLRDFYKQKRTLPAGQEDSAAAATEKLRTKPQRQRATAKSEQPVSAGLRTEGKQHDRHIRVHKVEPYIAPEVNTRANVTLRELTCSGQRMALGLLATRHLKPSLVGSMMHQLYGEPLCPAAPNFSMPTIRANSDLSHAVHLPAAHAPAFQF